MTFKICLPLLKQEIWAQYRIASPITKMPNCPNCGEDELGLMQPNEAFCYACTQVIERL